MADSTPAKPLHPRRAGRNHKDFPKAPPHSDPYSLIVTLIASQRPLWPYYSTPFSIPFKGTVSNFQELSGGVRGLPVLAEAAVARAPSEAPRNEELRRVRSF